jgi:hypothetical protein
MLEANGWDAPKAVELSKWWKALSKCNIPPIAIALSQGQSLGPVLFRRAIHIRHCAVHRPPQIPVNKVEEMIRDEYLLFFPARWVFRQTGMDVTLENRISLFRVL